MSFSTVYSLLLLCLFDGFYKLWWWQSILYLYSNKDDTAISVINYFCFDMVKWPKIGESSFRLWYLRTMDYARIDRILVTKQRYGYWQVSGVTAAKSRSIESGYHNISYTRISFLLPSFARYRRSEIIEDYTNMCNFSSLQFNICDTIFHIFFLYRYQ